MLDSAAARLVGLGLLLLGGLTVWRVTLVRDRLHPLRSRAPSSSTLGDTAASARRPSDRSAGAFWPGGPGADEWSWLGDSGRYRAGPWPGLSPAGGLVLLGCALLLGGGQLVLGEPRMALPHMLPLGLAALLPMALATRLVRAPGAASAVCGAYLLPRTVLSLLEPAIEPPPLLLVPAMAFDLAAWLRRTDLALLGRVTARVTGWRARRVTRAMAGPRRFGRWRGGVAGAIFGGALMVVEPAFAVLLGADPATWSGASVWLAGLANCLGCAMIGAGAASGREPSSRERRRPKDERPREKAPIHGRPRD